MCSLSVTHEELKSRPAALRGILRTLRRSRGTLGCDIIPGAPVFRATVIAAHEGALSHTDYRDLRFRTSAPDIRAQYFEIWKETGGTVPWCLHQAYLNLFRLDKAEHRLEEIISIHCDPGDEHEYKKGPHLHVQRAEPPLPKCHFPLNSMELDRVLASAADLTRAIENAVQNVCREVLQRFVA